MLFEACITKTGPQSLNLNLKFCISLQVYMNQPTYECASHHTASVPCGSVKDSINMWNNDVKLYPNGETIKMVPAGCSVKLVSMYQLHGVITQNRTI